MQAFLFGDTSQIAQAYYDSVTHASGPGVVDLHPDEMSRQALIDCMVYTAMAALEARQDDRIKVARFLHDQYDDLFVRVVAIDQGFRDRLTTGAFRPLKAGYDRNKGYYLKLAATV